MTTEIKYREVEFREVKVSDEGIIEGYLSTFNDVDSYGTYMTPTAFDNALSKFSKEGYLPALWQHDRTKPVGRWTELRKDEHGLYGKLKLTMADPQAQIAYAHAKDGSVRGFSIGFKIDSDDIKFDKKRDAYALDNVDLIECSIVTFPANDNAQITNVKQQDFSQTDLNKDPDMATNNENEVQSPADNSLMIELSKKIEDLTSKNDERIESLIRELSAIKSNSFAQNASAPMSAPAVSYEQRFERYIRTGVMIREDGDPTPTDPTPTPTVAGNTGTNTEGGYLVPDGLDKRVMELLDSKSVIRQNSTIITPEGNKYERIYKTSGIASGWVGETDARPATDAQTYQHITAELGELYAFPQYTQRFLADSWYTVQQGFVKDLSDTFIDKEETAFISGNGTGKPKGILTYTLSADGDKTRTWNNLQGIASGSATDVTLNSLIKAKDQLNTGYRANAKWYMNTNTYTALQQLLKDSDQRRIFGSVDVATNAPTLLLGYPIVICEYLPDIASGSNPIIFGDMKSGYAVLDRPGIGIVRDDLTNKPYVGFYSIKRVGGLVQDYRALKVVHVGTSL